MEHHFHIEDLGFESGWGGPEGGDPGPDANFCEWAMPTMEEFFDLDPSFTSDDEGVSINGIGIRDWANVINDPDRRIQFMILLALRQQNQILGRMYEAMLEANNINEKQANKEANDGN